MQQNHLQGRGWGGGGGGGGERQLGNIFEHFITEDFFTSVNIGVEVHQAL